MDDPLDRLVTQMVVLARRVEGASRRGPLHARMERAAYLIARALDDAGPASVNKIAQALSLDGSTVTRQVSAMEHRGFVTRSSHPGDGRAWVIELTPAGAEEMRHVSAARRERFAEFVTGWLPDEVDHFGRLLERFNAAIVANPAAAAQTAPSPPARGDHRRSVLPSRRHR